MKSKYKTYNNASIVTVTCGSDQGTAFFVKENLLLTARHILADAEENDDPVYIGIGRMSYVCKVIWQGDANNPVDLALLSCTDVSCPSPFRLLSQPQERKDIDLVVCGYPHENGGGRNQFEIPVTPIAPIADREYDVITAPGTLLPFVNYKGFSGSPVLNDSGSVVGVITDQLNAVLGFKSIASVVDLLAEQGLTCSSNWEIEDNNPYGLGHCRQLIERQVELAGDRYSDDVHVDNGKLIHDLEQFTDKRFLAGVTEQLNAIEKVYTDYAATLPEDKQIKAWDNKPYEKGSYTNIVYYLQQALKLVQKDPEAKDGVTSQNIRKAIDSADEKVKQFLEYNTPMCVIEGEAGAGKTHLICRFALHHGDHCYVYVIHGGQLVPSQDVEQQICRLCGFPDATLTELNQKMESVDKYGVIIIDAINECSSGSYWVDQLDAFRQTIERYSSLKLVLTLRTGTIILPYAWSRKIISGFEDVNEAVEKYFVKYGVPRSFDWKKFKGDFHNPLFLRLFCESHRYLAYSWHKDIRHIDVYLAYIQKRNVKISELVDEDIARNVTEKYLLKVASQSLYYEHCLDIKREKARKLGDGICYGRTWTKSLLKNALDENLLISLQSYYEDEEVVGFHFEKMGDFLRAYVLSSANRGFESKLSQLLQWEKEQRDNEEYEGKFKGLIGAFVDTYDGEENLLDIKAFNSGVLRPYLVEAIPYNTKYNNEIVRLLLKSMSPELVRALVSHFNDYGSSEIVTLHKALGSLAMPERDAVWSEAVNQFYNSYKYDFGNWAWDLVDKEDIQRGLVLYSWLLCSSYPDVRNRLIRRIYAVLKDNIAFVGFLLKATAGCNDLYVVEGVLCAIYGTVITTRNAGFVSSVANLVREIYYGEDMQWPVNLQIRKWALKIFERDLYLTPGSKHFKECTPPCDSPSPFVYLEKQNKASGNRTFFGETQGSQMIYASIFSIEDFARYIIGTNGGPTSRVFYYKDKEEEIALADIQEMTAQKIMDMGWNDELGVYDKGRYSRNRHENLTERLGKKYQWIAYHNILGGLTDHCRMKDRWEKPYRAYEHNYPWYTEDVNHFDPSLQGKVVSVGMLNWASPFGLDSIDAYAWVKDDEAVPAIRFIFKDQDGEEWVRIYGYESEDVKQNELGVEGFLFFNSHFVKNDDVATVRDWAKSQNFYGRWLPEAPDLYQFLWNEYPWSDSYKHTMEGEEWEVIAPRKGGGAKSMRSTLCQLQEDKRGLDSEDYLSNAYVPCEDMMKVLGLYTAERGTVRTIEGNEIVATSMKQLGVEHGGLAIKKRYLNQYIETTGNTLFFFITGEKLAKVSTNITGDGIKQLSACWYMDGTGFYEVQPITVMKEEPRKPKEQGAERNFDWLEEFIKEHPDFSIGDIIDTEESEDKE